MTLAFGIHRGTWSTFFHIKEYKCFGKIQCFTFSLFKSPRDQIWPWQIVGQGQPWVTIWTNLVGLSHLMSHTKFQGNQPSGSGEEDFLRFFQYMGIMAILFWKNAMSHLYLIQYPKRPNLTLTKMGRRSTKGHHLKKFSSTQSTDTTYQVSSQSAQWFWRRKYFKIFTIYGHGDQVDHVTMTNWTNLRSSYCQDDAIYNIHARMTKFTKWEKFTQRL